MARRSTVEKIQKATANVTSGASPVTVVTAGSDDIVSPRQIIIANASGSTATVTMEEDSTAFATVVISSGETETLHFTHGLELDKGADLNISTDQTVDVSLFYVVHDESAGVTKIAARTATYNDVITIRTPSNVKGQDKS